MTVFAISRGFGAADFLPWAIVGFAALLVRPQRNLSIAAMLDFAGIGLAWLGLYCLTGDRRLFFPYTIQFAIQAICWLDGRVRHTAIIGSVAGIGLFTVIRVLQSATLSVLVVEWMVAVAVLSLIAALWRQSSRTSVARLTLSALGGLLALAGLAL